MSEIRFKASRQNSGGYRAIIKEGDMEFDQDALATDGIWLLPTGGQPIIIDCNAKTGVFTLRFVGSYFDKATSYFDRKPAK